MLGRECKISDNERDKCYGKTIENSKALLHNRRGNLWRQSNFNKAHPPKFLRQKFKWYKLHAKMFSFALELGEI